jgi:hypothetical protein
MPILTLRPLTEEEKKREKPIPGDLYLDAEVVKVEERKLPFQTDDGQDIWNLEFTFKILDSDYYGKWIRGEVRKEFNESSRCRLRSWVQELFAQDLPSGFSLDTDLLTGKRCRILTYVKKYTKEGVENSVTIVTDVLRAGGDAPAQQLPSNSTDGLEPF